MTEEPLYEVPSQLCSKWIGASLVFCVHREAGQHGCAAQPCGNRGVIFAAKANYLKYVTYRLTSS